MYLVNLRVIHRGCSVCELPRKYKLPAKIFLLNFSDKGRVDVNFVIGLNLNNKDTNYQKISEKFLTIGGRGLIAILMNEEVRAQCYPLGPENKLIISNGPLAGLGISSAGRISIGVKSPLTGGIKESKGVPKADLLRFNQKNDQGFQKSKKER